MGMAPALRRSLRRSLINALAITSAVVATGLLTAVAQQKTSAGPFVSEQAATGETAYETTCSTCHAPDLTGREGPQLAGGNFMSDWSGRSIQDLVTYIQTTMPPDTAGSLPQETAVNIAAFLLQSNGAIAGSKPLTASASVLIRSVATGQPPQASAERGSGAGRSGAGGAAQRGPGSGVFPVNLGPAHGLTVSGKVKELPSSHR